MTADDQPGTTEPPPEMDSLAFLDKAGKQKVQPVYVLHGDEDFLKRQVLAGEIAKSAQRSAIVTV